MIPVDSESLKPDLLEIGDKFYFKVIDSQSINKTYFSSPIQNTYHISMDNLTKM